MQRQDWGYSFPLCRQIDMIAFWACRCLYQNVVGKMITCSTLKKFVQLLASKVGKSILWTSARNNDTIDAIDASLILQAAYSNYVAAKEDRNN